ncbi:MAG: ATP-binding protein [Oscillospiraceae bacterium]
MKQLLILSGKGGTGKTTVASAFIRLAGALCYADCDVDAPNLHLIMGQKNPPKRQDYFGMPRAEIDGELCVNCGECIKNCRFEAISVGKDGKYAVEQFDCEGCSLCAELCPAKAISMKPVTAGELLLFADEASVFSSAQLKMGSGHSGMLVTEVKKQMRAAGGAAPLAIIDGSPGVGCPVIASMSGVDMVLIVAEPSVSGISDMERILKTAEIFKVKTAVCVNKFDTSPENTEKIEAFCRENSLPFAGKIPFDPLAVSAINQGKTIVDIACPSGQALKIVYEKTIKILEEQS